MTYLHFLKFDLCPDIYGDVVFWTRGILSNLEISHSYDILSCEGEGGGGGEQRYSSHSGNKNILVTPNPAMNYFILENKTSFDALDVTIFDTYMQTTKIQDRLVDQLNIDCSNYAPGLYFINISHPSGFITIEKVIVVN